MKDYVLHVPGLGEMKISDLPGWVINEAVSTPSAILSIDVPHDILMERIRLEKFIRERGL